MRTIVEPRSASSALSVAITALIALALAMGVGRFAFTPMLPMMQLEGLTLQQGGWLASANYAGYLLGALSASSIRLEPARLVRIGLLLVVLTTLAMGWVASLAAWMSLRFVAGVASAWLLVSVAYWSLTRLQTLRRPALGSAVFSGVGLGIVLVGLTCMLLAGWGAASATGWTVLGAMTLVLAGCIWNDFGADDGRAESEAARNDGVSGDARERWRLVLCYGAFGLGYILPATFLPALARDVVSDPRVFGLAWPVFGAAAALSPWIANRLSERVARRPLWSACHLVMALGVVVPVFWHHPAAIALAALCVGGTFMVITMVGMQEARAVGGTAARGLMAAMTAAFAVGQLVGPLLVGATGGGMKPALLLATASLVASAAALRFPLSSKQSIHTRRKS